MCQISIGLGRDFFEQLRTSYIKNVNLRKKIDWILYYLQITKGFVMPNIDFFYDNKAIKNEFVLYNEKKEIFRSEVKNIKNFDLFEDMLFEIVLFLSNNADILFNNDSYEFYLENCEFYLDNNKIFNNISKEKCQKYLKQGKSIIFRKEISKDEDIPDISSFNKEDFKKIIRGMFLLSDEDVKEALDIFNTFSDDYNYIIPYFKIEIATKMGNIEIVDKLMKECDKRYSYYKDIIYMSATYFLSRENPYRFNQIIKKAKELYPDDIRFDFLLAKMYSYLEDDETAENIIKNIKVKEEQLFPGLLLDMAIVNNDFSTSEQLLLKALSMNEKHLPTFITLSNLYLNNNNLEKAFNTLEKAIEFYPQSAECHELMGEILHYMGREDESQAFLKKALIIENVK